MLCSPNFDNIPLKHQSGGVEAAFLSLRVSECEGSDCETDKDKAKKFIEQVSISSEGVFESIDFKKRTGLPVF